MACSSDIVLLIVMALLCVDMLYDICKNNDGNVFCMAFAGLIGIIFNVYY